MELKLSQYCFRMVTSRQGEKHTTHPRSKVEQGYIVCHAIYLTERLFQWYDGGQLISSRFCITVFVARN